VFYEARPEQNPLTAGLAIIRRAAAAWVPGSSKIAGNTIDPERAQHINQEIHPT
jgi:hypothetical protein